MRKFLTKVFGDTTSRTLKEISGLITKINDLEPQFEKLTDDQLAAKTLAFKERLAKGETLDDILPEAFAAVREASKRTNGQRHFDVAPQAPAGHDFGDLQVEFRTSATAITSKPAMRSGVRTGSPPGSRGIYRMPPLHRVATPVFPTWPLRRWRSMPVCYR